MLLRIGTNNHHLAIGLLYFYRRNEKGGLLNQLNLLEITMNKIFGLVISLWRPEIFISIFNKHVLLIDSTRFILWDKIIWLRA